MAFGAWTRKALRGLRRMLGLSAKGKSSAGGADGGRRRRDRAASLTPGEILGQAVDDGITKVYTITLENLAGAVGPDWERLRGKVDMITDSVVKRHFRRGSLSTALTEGSYVVMLIAPDNDDGRRRVIKLTDDLSHHLVGGRVVRRDKIQTTIGRLSPKELQAEDGRLKPFHEVAHKVEVIVAPRPEPPTLDGEGESDGEDTPKLKRVEGRAVAAPVADWAPIDSSAWKAKETQVVDADAPPPPLLMVTISFRPTWNVDTQSVDTHYCLPAVRQGRTVYSDRDAIAALGGATVWLDYEVIAGAMAALTNSGAASDIGTVVLPIHFASLRDAETRRILSALGSCARIVGPGNLMVDLLSVPYTLPLESITHALAPLGPHGVGVLLRMDLYDPHFSLLEALDPSGVTVDLSTMTDWQRQQDRFFRALARFRLGSRNQKMYLWGAVRRDEALAAIGAGFSLVDCRAMFADRESPGRPFSMSLASFKRTSGKRPSSSPPPPEGAG
ncbi:MAG: hypothetical protein ABT940_02955 [Alphaproteobacteria bacterium]